ncbi:MAG: hypothetical protein M0036_09390 [Desulfobacteraceae bacterium]|nr:hypothetical protein [Desulfobacteraceae bacterium]
MKKIGCTLKATAINLVFAAPLLAGYNIESAGSTNAPIFTRLVGFMQDFVDLLDGPFAIAVVIGGAFIAFCLWVFSPQSPALQKAFRAIAGGFVLFDMGVLINYMRS